MPAQSEKQRKLMAIAEHEPGKLYKENRGVLKMSHSQLHDFASTKGLAARKEHSPPHMLKREGISLESHEADKAAGEGKKYSKPDYISGEKNNPHGGRNEKTASWYKDHGRGNHYGEEDIEEENEIQEGKSSMDPRTVDEGDRKRRQYGFPHLSEPYEED